jgi:hypothetical protein
MFLRDYAESNTQQGERMFKATRTFTVYMFAVILGVTVMGCGSGSASSATPTGPALTKNAAGQLYLESVCTSNPYGLAFDTAAGSGDLDYLLAIASKGSTEMSATASSLNPDVVNWPEDVRDDIALVIVNSTALAEYFDEVAASHSIDAIYKIAIPEPSDAGQRVRETLGLDEDRTDECSGLTPEVLVDGWSATGNRLLTVGEPISLFSDRQKAATVTVTSVELDGVCDYERAEPAKNGHYLTIRLDAETTAAMAGVSNGYLNINEWQAVGASGAIVPDPVTVYCTPYDGYLNTLDPAMSGTSVISMDVTEPQGRIIIDFGNGSVPGWKYEFSY